MKKVNHGEFIPEMQELSMEEAISITGGESLWYWIGYGVGYVGYVITHTT